MSVAHKFAGFAAAAALIGGGLYANNEFVLKPMQAAENAHHAWLQTPDVSDDETPAEHSTFYVATSKSATYHWMGASLFVRCGPSAYDDEQMSIVSQVDLSPVGDRHYFDVSVHANGVLKDDTSEIENHGSVIITHDESGKVTGYSDDKKSDPALAAIVKQFNIQNLCKDGKRNDALGYRIVRAMYASASSLTPKN